MVDRSDLATAQQLYDEYRQIVQAVINFDSGGRIVMMAVRWDDPDDPDNPTLSRIATVPTQYMNYPPQMVEGIKQFFQQREREIARQLSDIGVTGLDQLALQLKKDMADGSADSAAAGMR